MSNFADLTLGELAEREFAARKLILREAPEKIGLVLRKIEGAEKLEAAGGLVAADARVVPGGQAIGADLASHAQQWLELHIRIAVGASNGRASAEIAVDERADNPVFELVL